MGYMTYLLRVNKKASATPGRQTLQGNEALGKRLKKVNRPG